MTAKKFTIPAPSPNYCDVALSLETATSADIWYESPTGDDDSHSEQVNEAKYAILDAQLALRLAAYQRDQRIKQIIDRTIDPDSDVEAVRCSPAVAGIVLDVCKEEPAKINDARRLILLFVGRALDFCGTVDHENAGYCANLVLYGTTDPNAPTPDGHGAPAVTTLLFTACDNDPDRFAEATRLIELFIFEAFGLPPQMENDQ